MINHSRDRHVCHKQVPTPQDAEQTGNKNLALVLARSLGQFICNLKSVCKSPCIGAKHRMVLPLHDILSFRGNTAKYPKLHKSEESFNVTFESDLNLN